MDKTVSAIIKEKLLPDGVVKTDKWENVYPGNNLRHLLRRCPVNIAENVGKIFFGRYIYTDVFQIRRLHTFKLRLLAGGKSEPLEGCYSDWE